ncbi:MAG: hypothetical protein ABR499_02080 [Gemmatimonadaceae bacterium]
MRHRQRAVPRLATAVAAALLLYASPLGAQTPSEPAAPAVNVSGVIFGNYQYHLGGQSKDFNQFLLDRAYVTVRASVSERTSIRVTSDVFQSGDQNGWTIRAKYAYLQYDLWKRARWNTALRAGMLHNVVVEHLEQFWPRFVSQVALERSGGFASADVGAAAVVTLPARVGEVYAHVVNGPGYTRREGDRFKDYAARLSLTPLAGRLSGPLSTLTISPWIYEGAIASRFVRGGGGGIIAPVGEGLPRDRYGVVVGIRDPRLTGGIDIARMRTVTDTLGAGTTPTRVVTDARANVLAAFGVLRPLAFVHPSRRSRFGLIARYDDVESNTAADDRYHFLIAGLLFDVNARSTIVLDYQEQLTNSGAPALPAPGSFRTLFAHVVVNF